MFDGILLTEKSYYFGLSGVDDTMQISHFQSMEAKGDAYILKGMLVDSNTQQKVNPFAYNCCLEMPQAPGSEFHIHSKNAVNLLQISLLCAQLNG